MSVETGSIAQTPPEPPEPPDPGDAEARSHAAVRPSGPSTGTAAASRMRVLAWGVLVVGVSLRTWAAASGWFYWDDFILIGRSGTYPAWSSDLLLYDHDGHLMPAAFALTDWLTALAPFDFGAAVFVLGALQLAAGASVLLMLRTLVGDRAGVVVGLAIYLLSPLALPSFVWWAASLNALPLQVSLALGITAAVRMDRAGGVRPLLLGALALLVGLAFFEKSVLMPLAALGVVVVLRVYAHGFPRGLRLAIGTQWRLCVLWAVIGAVYLALYLRVVERAVGVPDDLGLGMEMLGRGVTLTVVPTLVGGPVRWAGVSSGAAFADPPGWQVALSWAVLMAVVVVTVGRVPRRAWAWLLGFGYVLADLVVLVVGRSAEGVLPQLAQSQRYTADSAVVIAAVAVLVVHATELGAPEARHRRWTPSRRVRIALGGTAVVLVLAGWAWSTAAFVTLWRQNEAKPYVQTAQASLAQNWRETMLDHPVPQEVLYGLAAPNNMVSRFFSPLSRQPEVVESLDELVGLNRQGEFADLVLDVQRRGTAPVDKCATKVGPAAVVVPLDGPLIEWTWVVRIPYIASDDTQVRAQLSSPGAPERTVDLRAGVGQVYVELAGGGDRLLLEPAVRGSTTCVGAVEVGLVATP